MELFQTTSGKVRFKLDTARDKISAYMVGKLDEDKLGEQERKIMKRWLAIWTLLRNYHSPQQAIEAHMKTQAAAGDPIALRTAYNDLKNATEIWGNFTKISRDAQLVLLNEYALKTFKLAADKKRIDLMNKALANLIKVTQLTEPLLEGEEESHTYVLELQVKKQNGEAEAKTIQLDQLNQIKKSDYYDIVEAVEQNELDVSGMKRLLTGNGNDGAENDQPQ